MLSFKKTFPLSSCTFIKRLFSSSSLSAIRVVSSAYLRLLIFLPAILVPAYASSSPREYQIVRTHTKETLEYKTQHHPTTNSTLCRMPHLNSKQNKNTNPIISRQDYHLTQPCPSEEKQANKQKLSTNLTLYEGHTNHWTNFRREETKRKKGSRK